MKFFKAFVIISILCIQTSCSQKKENKIIQLSNQSYSQMMSYVILGKDDSLIVIDGGTKEDLPHLLDVIRKNSKDMVVDAWFLTHYHKDHTGALTEYLSSKNNEISINKIYYNFPKENWVEENEINRLNDYKLITSELEKIDNSVVINEDNIIEFDDFEINVIRVFNPNIVANAGNNSSTVYKMNLENTSAIFLGDLGIEGGIELINKHSEEIQNTDYVQMSHHGQAGVSEDVYNMINPKYCMWPTPDWLWENKENLYKIDETKEWVKKHKSIKNYVANNGDITIKIK